MRTASRASSDRSRLAHSSGQSIVQVRAGSTTQLVTLTSYGWSDEDLVGLSRPSTSAGPAPRSPIRRCSPTTGCSATCNRGWPCQPPGGAGLLCQAGRRPERLSSQSLLLGAAVDRPARRATLDRQVALRFFLDDNTTFTVDGHIAVAGSVVGQPGLAMATWIAGDHVVTVSGSMPVQQLIDIATTVHQVPADEWEGMKFQATRNGATGSRPIRRDTAGTGLVRHRRRWQIVDRSRLRCDVLEPSVDQLALEHRRIQQHS